MTKRIFGINRIISFLVLILLLSSCGTTQILVNRSDIDIFVDNVHKGKGRAELIRTGAPMSKTLTAKYNGQTVGEIIIKRHVNFETVLAGLLTIDPFFGVGFLLCWKYPETVIIPTNLSDNLPFNKPSNKESIWLQPPKHW